MPTVTFHMLPILVGLMLWGSAGPAGAQDPVDSGTLPTLEDLAAQIIADDDLPALTTGDVLVDAVLEPRTGGLARIRERGFLRMAVAPDPLMIAFDGERALGVATLIAQEIERHLATLPDASATPTVVVPTPMPRLEIQGNLEDGRTDFTTMTVTRAEEDPALTYTTPLITQVNDVIVLADDVGDVGALDDMVTVPIYVARDSRYAANAEKLNERRLSEGKAPLDITYVDGRLDDYDLIEMVEIGLIPATIATDFKARFWQTIYKDVVVRDDLKLTRNGRIAWALRANNPELQKVLDDFAETAKQGTLLGNIALQQYADSAEWIQNIGSDDARTRIDEVGPIITRYARENGFDPDLVLAQAYQESRLDQAARSHVGAIGVMQVMPATAADPVVGIPDVTGLDDNVRAGVKYLRWLRDTFFDDPDMDPLDRTLLSFAAYNAGPGGVARARKLAVQMGLDPDVWFENVEVAIQRSVSREPAIYVRNIFKYYVSRRLLADLEAEAEEARGDLRAIALGIDDPETRARRQFEEDSDDVAGDRAPGSPMRR